VRQYGNWPNCEAARCGGTHQRTPRLGLAWLLLCVALALHVTDEALTGFLNVWNPTVAAVHVRWPWFPMPTFRFDVWLGGLIALVVVLFAASPRFFHGAGVLRLPAYVFSALMVGNGLGHAVATALGHTVPEVRLLGLRRVSILRPC
jgi:hypothetical protein